jgi:hypothetical protein
MGPREPAVQQFGSDPILRLLVLRFVEAVANLRSLRNGVEHCGLMLEGHGREPDRLDGLDLRWRPFPDHDLDTHMPVLPRGNHPGCPHTRVVVALRPVEPLDASQVLLQHEAVEVLVLEGHTVPDAEKSRTRRRRDLLGDLVVVHLRVLEHVDTVHRLSAGSERRATRQKPRQAS